MIPIILSGAIFHGEEKNAHYRRTRRGGADIITTFNTKTCTPSPEVESEAHCLGHMRPWTQSTHHENNLKNIKLPSSSTNSSMKSFLFDYILHHQFRFKFNAIRFNIFLINAELNLQVRFSRSILNSNFHHHPW